MAFLPRQEEIQGWRLVDDPLVYPADKLTTYLASDAQHFRKYDVIDLTVGEYHRVDGGGVGMVEIFRFPDFVKAFGAFSTRRTPGALPLEIPNQSFAAANSIHVWRGPFYYRILGSGTANLAQPLNQLAAGIAAGMPAAPGTPAVFRFLPETNRVPNSEMFSAGGAFGQPILANGFTTKYRVNGTDVDGLILPTPSKEAATRILQQFEQFFRTNGRLLDPIPNLGEGNFTAEDRFFGRAVAFRLDRFVIAFRGYGARQQLVDLAIATDQRILGTIRKQLEVAEEAQEAAQNQR